MVESGTILSGANPMSISPVALFLIQTCLIIATSRLLTIPLKWLRQPAVIAEVLGGLLLGASCLSQIPAFKENVFPKSSMPMIKLVAEIGLIFYLFLVGLELDPVELIKTFKKSVSISVAGIAIPFALGCAIANLIYVNYADPTVSYVSFLLFMGISMSITAFPVLARILTERKLLHTPVGQATISAAAVDDFIAWALLVLVIALINNSKHGDGGPQTYLTALYVCLCIIAYAVFLWMAIRPVLRRLLLASVGQEHLHQLLLFFVFLLVLFSSWFTEIIGVQAIFGAFLVGVIMPHDHGFAVKLASQIEDLVTIVFLPLFFAYSGLNTRLGLLDDAQSWGFVFLVCVVACAGKMIGCTVTAKFSGLNWRESTAVGILMNTRGLVQIIVLNVGLNAGVITDKIFAMFVLMAIFTTFLTVPLISVVYPFSYYSQTAKAIDDDLDKEATAADLVPSHGQDDLRALVLLPSINVVSSVLTLSTVLSGSRYLSSFTVFALRLVKMDDRLTTVMQFANRKNIKQDPLLNIFQTFSTIYGFVSNPLLKFTETSDIVSTVVNTAKQSSANVIVIPQAAVVGEEAVVGDASSWLGDDATQTTRQLAHSVWLAVPSISVVRFIDRGFLNPSSGVDSTSLPQSILQPRYNNTPSKLGGESTTPTPLNPTTVTIVLITAGLSDSSEEESIRLVQHLTSSDTISQQSIHFSVHILRVGAAAAAAAAAAAGNLTNSGALSIASEISLKSDMTTRTVGIRDAVEEQIEEGAIPSLSSRVAALATGHKDLVVVGVSALKEFESKQQHQQQFIIEGGKQSGGVGGGSSTGGFESWLEYESAASIAIVYGTRN